MSAQVCQENAGGGGLSHLVEAATALSKLLEVSAPKAGAAQQSPLVSPGPVTVERSVISDDEDQSCKKPEVRSKKEIFPQRLMAILADPSLSDVVTWLPNGRAFVIIRPDVFTETVLPKYLPPVDARGSTKYPSFTRKLNRWGFRQITRGPDTGAFHHRFFRRDEPQICLQMACQRIRDRRSSSTAKTSATTSLPPKKRLHCTPNRPILPWVPDPYENKPVVSSSTSTTVSMDDNTSASSVPSASSNSSSSRSSTPILPATVCTQQLHPIAPNSSSSATTMSSDATAYMSKDSSVIAVALRQSEQNERIRVAKAMLYHNYLQALQEKRS